MNWCECLPENKPHLHGVSIAPCRSKTAPYLSEFCTVFCLNESSIEIKCFYQYLQKLTEFSGVFFSNLLIKAFFVHSSISVHWYNYLLYLEPIPELAVCGLRRQFFARQGAFPCNTLRIARESNAVWRKNDKQDVFV